MPQACRISITTGPERGKVFEIDDELVHIGRSAENQIVLDDPSLSDHHASILRKNGRFAIYRSGAGEVQVDGGEIPTEKWVWLPQSVRLQFGRRTSGQLTYEEYTGPDGQPADAPVVEFESASGEDESSNSDDAAVGTKKKVEKKKRKRQVARFITDKGDPLVELGADGQLPELALQEGQAGRERSTKPKETNPLVLYSVLALSFVMTLGLLLLDNGMESRRELSKAEARRKIATFYGRESDELKPYQLALRAAHLAHSRADRRTELQEYRLVLDALTAEDANQHIGLTGHFESDKELKRLIGIIISND